MIKPIEKMQEKSMDILLLFSTVFIFALGINLLTTFISNINGINNIILLVIALVLFTFGFFLIKTVYFTKKSYIVRLRGGALFKFVNKKLQKIPIMGYQFNDDFFEYLNSFLNENKACAKIFSEEEDIKSLLKNGFNPDSLCRSTIIKSVLEFLVLHKLELHLGRYFVENEIGENKIAKIDRSILDKGILRNRVIDSITKDMKERDAFLSENIDCPEGRVVYQTSKRGVVYQCFEISVPPGSKIYRDETGYIVISNKLFRIRIIPIYQGCSTIISQVLLYNQKDYISPISVNINLEIKLTKTFIRDTESIQLYQWLDSFVEEMENYVSIENIERVLNTGMLEIINSLLIQSKDSKKK